MKKLPAVQPKVKLRDVKKVKKRLNKAVAKFK